MNDERHVKFPGNDQSQIKISYNVSRKDKTSIKLPTIGCHKDTSMNISSSNNCKNIVLQPLESVDAMNSKSAFSTGIYDPQVNSLYQNLTKENPTMPPPLMTQPRNLFNVYDHNNITERKLVLEDFKKIGPISKFERDELYVPETFRKNMSCQICKKSYVAKMFTKQFLKRNNREPHCSRMRVDRPGSRWRGHFCDVLGKKYCSYCTERENRKVLYPKLNMPKYFREISHASHIGKIKRRKIGIDLSFTCR